MKNLPVLKSGDSVELIAPASRCSDSQLNELKDLCASWQLNCIVKKNIFADDLLCANTDKQRLDHLKEALLNPETKAIICVRGGYGAMRLIPGLSDVHPPLLPKLFVGMSDITCLQLYLQQKWGWATIHGGAAPGRFSPASIASLKSILFAEVESVEFPKLKALNHHARVPRMIESQVTGGNLTLIQAGMGTEWQMDGRNKLILLEEVAERGYRIDRMLEHLQQAKLFQGAFAILLGDFLEGNEPDGSSLIQPVLERFAKSCPIPVVQVQGVGHGRINFPIPCGTKTQLQLGEMIHLSCFR